MSILRTTSLNFAGIRTITRVKPRNCINFQYVAPISLRQVSNTSGCLSSSETTTSTSFSGLREEPTNRGNPKIRTTFFTLILMGALATATGLYIYYDSFNTWPPELRDDLRAAIKAQRAGEHRKAKAAFKRALEVAQSLPEERFGDDALLKVSGISIALASCLENSGDYLSAYEAYTDSLNWVRIHATTAEERLRAVALAQKSGDLAKIPEVATLLPPLPSGRDENGTITSHAEQHLRWSVEELLRLAIPPETRSKVLEGNGDSQPVVLAELDLPPWLDSVSLGASLEALGQLYASQRRSALAIPLYIQAINLLMPPKSSADQKPKNPTVAERCRTGILMNNIAQLIIDARDVHGKIDDSLAWALRGLDIVAFTLRGTGWDQKGGQGIKNVQGDDERRTNEVKALCYTAEVALLINLGELSRIKKNDCKAREFFQKAYVRSDLYGMREARSRAAQALSELEQSSKNK